MASSSGRVLVIAARQGGLYKFAKQAGCDVFARGWSEYALREAVQRMESSDEGPDDYDLIVLDGHGRETADYCSGKERVVLEAPTIAARGILFSLCWGGCDHYVEAARRSNPGIVVYGPTGLIGQKACRVHAIQIIERVLEGDDLASAVEAGDSDSKLWKLTARPTVR